ncbi:DNA mismatch repair protein MutS [Pleomorphomonas sp. T1.2MG-36]|uniref:DNA mismatch repair protein MutS n=1 Tax=Pleomorphomonas sp. T1.2MG-36 TaxID=3041167 RepID=UPI002477B325|nr:DNA mismatch repair protein MutS [Pleomorphomonas sp. T1.2MG-36]CAI9412228.1 DNA mismatch repair protein MutS [Pleomorphomonas sp. T1.2MG-36]
MTDVQALPDDRTADVATPAMAQFIEIKAANPDCLLFYRMGDFYEMFFKDAEVASRALGITLTKRGKYRGEDIPLCGVPVHAADDYLQRLIALGHRVAVCEQMEDPAEAKKRGSKSVVRRDVVRLVTPGTLTEDNLLDARRSNYLAAVARQKGTDSTADGFAVAWADMSTGAFRLAETSPAALPALLARIEPRELLAADGLFEDDELRRTFKAASPAVVPLPRAFFDAATAEHRLADFFSVASLDAFGSFTRLELTAAAAIVAYVDKTQIGSRPPLDPPARESLGGALAIDAASRANLELSRTLSGERRGSLLHAIDRTVSGAGARLLADRLAAPLADPDAIRDRLDAVDFFLSETTLRARLRRDLAGAPDMARALTRISLDRGGPRDLAAIAGGLAAAVQLAGDLRDAGGAGPEIDRIAHGLEAAPADLAGRLTAALDDELPLLKRDGGFVRPGFRADLDEARALRDESRQVIAALQQTYAETAGIKSLKVRHNGVLGYFIEVAPNYAQAMTSEPLNRLFIHRQTLAGAMRFSTTELSELEGRIASAAERALAVELSVFAELARETMEAGTAIKRAADMLAALDVATALAELAAAEGYVRPRVDDSLTFRIDGGRHPVVEQVLREDGGSFVANGCDVGGEAAGKLWLVTGPNMAGKSTFLRQNALIAVLAQIGSFVPARSAHIGVVDRLFSRVGAADDLARGRSTFMVEMIETAAILNQAGPRSFVILDEIGRGTATYDGLSIAWATIEHLHEANRCRTLFATHYHELTALSERLPRVVNATVKVKEWRGDVVFLHEIVPGSADRSYGIQVAKLAGLPRPVIERARSVLAELEKSGGNNAASMLDDLPLFSLARHQAAAAPVEMAPDPAEAELLAAIDALAPDELSPREALEAVYRLKALRMGIGRAHG